MPGAPHATLRGLYFDFSEAVIRDGGCARPTALAHDRADCVLRHRVLCFSCPERAEERDNSDFAHFAHVAQFA